MWIINKCESQIIDSDTSFLYETLEEELYMNIPPLMVEALVQDLSYDDGKD